MALAHRWSPEATSAVFYPGQLIFALPIDYSLKFNLYIAAHMLLAAWGAFALARCLLTQRSGDELTHCSVPEGELPTQSLDRQLPDARTTAALRLLAAGFCSLSYAFSGAVLFQYCNIVFLVGAAWLPLALLAAVRMLAERSLLWALALGTCLALMVLGGDPQAAYHAGLLAALWAWFQRRDTAPTSHVHDGDGNTGQRRPAVHRHALSLLAMAAVSGACLSAVQIVPALSGQEKAIARSLSIREIFTRYLRIWHVPGRTCQGRIRRLRTTRRRIGPE